MTQRNDEKNIQIIKGTKAKVDKGLISNAKKVQLQRAIRDLNANNIGILQLKGKVRKMASITDKQLYVYRMSPHDRIIFTVDDGIKTIRDIVDIQAGKSILIPPKEK